ncbi:MAG: VCBS repeat-containing protein, partial [Candidatus Krumholzibacteriota bacterium]|nr:VCBS repeat-containing protein [Candidatus Krumholzibacteriota bacterium]
MEYSHAPGRRCYAMLGRLSGWLTGVCLAIAAAPALPQTPSYPADPLWRSDESRATRSVALGDIDRDGDLDLVCGNLGGAFPERNTIYLNDGGVLILSTSPQPWNAVAQPTLSVALGDVDGDGDLDLVCGNVARPNTLYLNEGGVFAVVAAWTSGAGDTTVTSCVALGDVDGDGDLDLICGNFRQPDTIYLNHFNEGGTFSAVPDWSSDRSDSTRSVALGHIDADGFLDIAFGNVGSNTLYLNRGGGVFPLTPDWFSSAGNLTTGVALGDIDGDGALDLVCANFAAANTAYRNTGTVFETTPAWSSGPSDSTQGVGLGDVDNDGKLDLVFAEEDKSNTLYVNVGGPGIFATTPVSFSVATKLKTFAVALGDMDSDGDLDAVFGNHDQSNTLYANESGSFGTTPDW